MSLKSDLFLQKFFFFFYTKIFQKGRIEELERLTEQLTTMAVADLKQRDGRELAMSAIVHGNRLLDAINQGWPT